MLELSAVSNSLDGNVSKRRFHVVIIGGGLGGLCLAQGLKQAGISAAVYERDRSPTDRLKGYWIELNADGYRALRECLTRDLFEALAATCRVIPAGLGPLNYDLREMKLIGRRPAAGAPAQAGGWVNRITLRAALLTGLDEVVHFSKQFTRYAEMPGAQIVAHFADGSRTEADVLVAADGGNSRVRRQFLPHAQRIETGIVVIGATTPLTHEIARLLPARLLDHPAAIIAPDGQHMFVGVWNATSDEMGFARGSAASGAASSVMWRFSAPRTAYDFNQDPSLMSGADLKRTVLTMIRFWHPNLQALVKGIDPAAMSVLPILTSVPIEPWQTGRITLVGDAIHSMTPYLGNGANMALRDASLLCRNLVSAARCEKPLLHAIHDYETEMIEYGFNAVRRSLEALQQAVGAPPSSKTF
jgi:salicylate hydroxylase